MSHLSATPALLSNVLARVPEGFLTTKELQQRFTLPNFDAVEFHASHVGKEGDVWFDEHRLTDRDVRSLSQWCHPTLPQMTANGYFIDLPVLSLREKRFSILSQSAGELLLFVAARFGYVLQVEISDGEDLQFLLSMGFLHQYENFYFDPLYVGVMTIRSVHTHWSKHQAEQAVFDYLEQQSGHVAILSDLRSRFGKATLSQILPRLARFDLPPKGHTQPFIWVYLPQSDSAAAIAAAKKILRKREKDELARVQQQWESLLAQCGDELRLGAKDGTTPRMRVLNRSYRLEDAAKRFNVSNSTLELAVNNHIIAAFTDPTGTLRVPAQQVHHFADQADLLETISLYETIAARDIALVLNIAYSTARRRLERAKLSRTEPVWGEVRGKWKLPNTLAEFKAILTVKLDELQAERDAKEAEVARQLEVKRNKEEAEKNALRNRLLDAFPTWQHIGRIEQRIHLHIGPPNSGKTYHALQSLASASSGWYLAPLRLLAFEVFDRLNREGIRCNLLTGEEHIDVEGATITAATVEMFNPDRSGECVVIDEAQMLADSDRGWAWTRALMEAQAPIIHVIGPTTVRNLLEKLAQAATIPISIIEHERLAPIQIAERNWPLNELPPKTILVAFSRQMVLSLKIELEKMRRTVSVVYGNLPPEVRRRQADRFAEGATEICIATDAVGMGLNLPADHVCFYEIEKFDGHTVRQLTSSEIQQIGGRAGRYGLSQGGTIGSVSKKDLAVIRELYYAPPALLTHARVAPSVEDLEMLPGSLAERLSKWASLQSIPDSLRSTIQTADMDERIELARLLTDEQVNQLGLSAALRLVNAPTRQNTRNYWLVCARAIVEGRQMPMPQEAPQKIITSTDLENIETCVSAADIYLWLAGRREFHQFGEEEAEVRIRRQQWSMRIDVALAHRLDVTRKCSKCGKPLPLRYPYGMCNDCFNNRFQDDNASYRDFRSRRRRPHR